MGYFRPKTKRGFDLFECASAMQKAVRRGDAKMAGYWACELYFSGYAGYAWKRLLVMSAEDCHGIITGEVVALYDAFTILEKKDHGEGCLFVTKAAYLLARGKKSRDVDHLICLVYKADAVSDEQLLAEIAASKDWQAEIPDEALDQHTQRGQANGWKKDAATVAKWIKREHAALVPRELGLFDSMAEGSPDCSWVGKK